MTEYEFDKTPFYAGLMAKVKTGGDDIIILVASADFIEKYIEDPIQNKYDLEAIIEFIPPLCDRCGAKHHPGMNTLCDKWYKPEK